MEFSKKSPRTASGLFLALFFLATAQLAAQRPQLPENEQHEATYGAPDWNFPDPPHPEPIGPGNIAAGPTPKIEVTFEPLEDGAFVYEPVAAWTGSQKDQAQFTMAASVKNLGEKTLIWYKTEIVYNQNGSQKTKTWADADTIKPGKSRSTTNGRPDYDVVGDVLYWEKPFPTGVTVKLYFEGYNLPVTFSKAVKPYSATFGLPFKSADLGPEEMWYSSSTHVGGSQVFAYDMKVVGLVNGKWSSAVPNEDPKTNKGWRVWGKRIYAMADGVVEHYLNDCGNNPYGVKDTAEYHQYEHGGAGNHFYIQHGPLMAMYAHLQQGSLNPKLMQVGAVVKKGDFLGLAGNSGSSTGPHFHIQVYKCDDVEKGGPIRPLLFNEGHVIDINVVGELKSGLDWTKLDGKGIPGLATHKALIWPGSVKPIYR